MSRNALNKVRVLREDCKDESHEIFQNNMRHVPFS